MKKRHAPFLQMLVLLALLFSILPASPSVTPAAAAVESTTRQRDERILHMDVSAAVAPDASIIVSERIVFTAEHREINRGLIRTIPMVHKEDGILITADFTVLSVKMDGATVPYALQRQGGEMDIHLGDDSMLAKGRHEYVLTYHMTRQLLFHDDADELYWNVTGNDWIFPIDKATYRVILPQGAQIAETDAATGPAGADGKNWRRLGDGSFKTTRPLAPGEGFTVSVAWPKGFVTPPLKTGVDAVIERFGRSNLLAAAGLLVFAWYAGAWLLVGRDPRRKLIVPAWQPPDDLEPGYIGYAKHLHFGPETLMADLLDLAVRGYLTVATEQNVLTLRKTAAAPPGDRLSEPHRALMEHLFGSGKDTRCLRSDPDDNGLFLDAAFTETTLEKLPAFYGMEAKKYAAATRPALIAWNRKPILFGILSFIPLGVLLTRSMRIETFVLFVFACLLSIFMGVLFTFLSKFIKAAFQLLREAKSNASRHAPNAPPSTPKPAISIPVTIGVILFFGFFGFTMLAAFIGILLLAFSEAPVPASWLLFSLVSAIFFSVFMKARTPAGRALLDKIEGFEMYLKTAERHRFEKLYPKSAHLAPSLPQQTPLLFERLLPYATALGVAETWADAYTAILANAHYAPAWTNDGGTFNPHAFTRSIRSIGDSLPTASGNGEILGGSNRRSSRRSGSSRSGGGRGGGGGRGR